MKTKEEFKAFMNYAAIARNRFVNKVNEQDWNRELREESENILIAYDQLRERLEDSAKEVCTPRWVKVTELLQESVNQIEYFHIRFRKTGSGNSLLIRIKSFLEESNTEGEPDLVASDKWELIQDFISDCVSEKHPSVRNIIAGLKFLGYVASNNAMSNVPCDAPVDSDSKLLRTLAATLLEALVLNKDSVTVQDLLNELGIPRSNQQ